MNYEVLLYYRFFRLSDPQAYRDEHYALCSSLGLKGRILVAPEGINGTVSGPAEATAAYRAALQNDPRTAGIEFKIDLAEAHAFNKLHVRVKPELVNMQAPFDYFPGDLTAPFIEPQDMARLMQDPERDVVLLDLRSKYEWDLGRFEGAIPLPIENFRELPELLPQLENLKDKTIITYCTGGIRCEKGTGFLMEQGFTQVYQLHGGIIRYAHETGGPHFEGQCYVFDNRVAVPINTVNPSVVASCSHCGQPSERFVNCANADCNLHLILCEKCADEMQGCCSPSCQTSPKRRLYDGTGQYHRGVNSKAYASGFQREARPHRKKPEESKG